MDRTRVEHAGATTSRWLILKDLLLGCCIGAVGAALVWQFYPGFWKEPDLTPRELAQQRREALQAGAQRLAQAAAAVVAAPVPAPSPCEMAPLFPPRQARDAEVALLAACREKERAVPGPTAPRSRVLGLLGDRYLAAAADAGNPPELRQQLFRRAREVLALSAQGYAHALGPNASRSRHARERLAALDRDPAAAVEPVAPTPQRGEVVAPARPELGPGAPASPAARPEGERRASATASLTRDADAAAPGHRVPAAAEAVRAAASDPELRQLASDLARLRAQAEAVSADPARLQRRAAAARAQRDRCGDAACLRAWYATRRRQLLSEF